jgi:dihydroorotase
VKLLIKNGRVVSPQDGLDETLDILIDSGRIVDLKAKLDVEADRVLDASRLVVAPGFIDMHAHLREPGQEEKETILTGTRAAARGGFTTVCCMPNTNPVNDNSGVTQYILSEAARRGLVNVLPIAAVTRGLQGEQLTDMADLAAVGAAAFSDDGRPVAGSQIMRRAMEYSKLLEALIIDHCEDRSLSEDGVMHEGRLSYLFGLRGIPAAAEEVMIARDIILAESLGARLHIAHLSVRGALPLLRAAKARGVQVSAEVTPHHLCLTDAACETYDTNVKVNPPLRSAEDVEALTAAVKEGLIDVFATDHAPHTVEDKEMEFDKAPFGINGLETAVSLLLDRLVHKGLISLDRLVEMMSVNPARLLKLSRKGRVAAGADADLTLLNLQKESTVDAAQFQSKSRNTPFHGWKLKGMPVMTVVAGRVVYPFPE